METSQPIFVWNIAHFRYNFSSSALNLKEKSQLNMLFENTINEIVIGKVFKVSSLEHSGYKYFNSWARHEPDFINLSPKQFSKFCEKVNEASSVFDNWNVIVRNLTDHRMNEIDGRPFSVRQFFLAKTSRSRWS